MYGDLPTLKSDEGVELTGWPVQIANPKKLAILRLPTNVEYLPYAHSIRVIVKGDDAGEERATPEASRTLFKLLRLDSKGVEFDDYEIEFALNRMFYVIAGKVERDGNDGETYTVQLRTPFGDVEHSIAIPTLKDEMEYRRYANRTLGKDGTMKAGLKVSADFYDKNCREHTGYSTKYSTLADIPINHKHLAVLNFFSKLRRDLDPIISPNS